MSTLTTAPADGTPVRHKATHRITFTHVLHSEWIKFWSLRSTLWALASTVVVMAAVSYVAVFFTARDAFDPATKPADAAPLVALPDAHPSGEVTVKIPEAHLGAAAFPSRIPSRRHAAHASRAGRSIGVVGPSPEEMTARFCVAVTVAVGALLAVVLPMVATPTDPSGTAAVIVTFVVLALAGWGARALALTVGRRPMRDPVGRTATAVVLAGATDPAHSPLRPRAPGLV